MENLVFLFIYSSDPCGKSKNHPHPGQSWSRCPLQPTDNLFKCSRALLMVNKILPMRTISFLRSDSPDGRLRCSDVISLLQWKNRQIRLRNVCKIKWEPLSYSGAKRYSTDQKNQSMPNEMSQANWAECNQMNANHLSRQWRIWPSKFKQVAKLPSSQSVSQRLRLEAPKTDPRSVRSGYKQKRGRHRARWKHWLLLLIEWLWVESHNCQYFVIWLVGWALDSALSGLGFGSPVRPIFGFFWVKVDEKIY